MRISRFLYAISLVTVFCLVYVYQQTEIFRMAYVGQQREALFQDLLDKNTLLRYNIESRASVVRIGSRILQDNVYEMPGDFQTLAYASDKKSVAKANLPHRENILAKLLSVKSEAQAGMISSPKR